MLQAIVFLVSMTHAYWATGFWIAKAQEGKVANGVAVVLALAQMFAFSYVLRVVVKS